MNPRNWPRGRMLLIAGAALPMAASLGFHAVQRAPRTPTPSTTRAALAFDQYLVNLGDLHNSPRVEAHFSFKNCGKGPVRVTKLEPSCSCLHTQIEKRTYQPGEICDFALGVLTTHETPGPHEYSLTIHYEDPQPRMATVAMKLVIRREVTISPSGEIFYQDGIHETNRTVTITDMRPKPFRVTGASCKSSLVKVTVNEPVDDPDGGRETSVSITAAPVCPKGGEDAFVSLYTDDSRYPRIQIPVWIRRMKRLSPIRQASHQEQTPAKPHTAH